MTTTHWIRRIAIGFLLFCGLLIAYAVYMPMHYAPERAITRAKPKFEAWATSVGIAVKNFEGPYLLESRGGKYIKYVVIYKTPDNNYVFEHNEANLTTTGIGPNDWTADNRAYFSQQFSHALLYKNNEALFKAHRFGKNYPSLR
ncbi:MAG: hypothetical protein KC475_02095 [Cyanobacteria bacterium HKST-UBA03]|nr:hypothetical protein [Cyanobacteria bacterium HKST-UBA03]